MPRYEVSIVYKGQRNYVVEADDEDDAADKGLDRYKAREKGEETGAGWEAAENVVVKPLG